MPWLARSLDPATWQSATVARLGAGQGVGGGCVVLDGGDRGVGVYWLSGHWYSLDTRTLTR